MSAASPSDTFRQEAQDLLEQLEHTLLDLERTPGDPDLIASAFRALHTIKGSGSMFGFEKLAALTHHIETAFDLVRKGRMQPDRELIAVALAASDQMRCLIDTPDDANDAISDRMVRDLRAVMERGAASASTADRLPAADLRPSVQPVPSADLRPAAELLPLAEFLPAAAPPAAITPAPAVAPSSPAVTTWRIGFRLPKDAMATGTNPLLLLDELRGLGPCTVVARTAAIPPLELMGAADCHLGWDVVLTTDQSRAVIEQVFLFVLDEIGLTIEPVASPASQDSPAETPADRGGVVAPPIVMPAAERSPPAPLPADAPPPSVDRSVSPAEQPLRKQPRAAAGDDSIRVPAGRLDELMDRVGELVIAQSRLNQVAACSDDPHVKSVAEEIERLVLDLRDTSMGVRMVEIGSLFGRFRRLVRDLGNELGKDAELITEGEDTELDKTVIERLNDPLVHLIRNAIDHGMETTQSRQAVGKPAQGRIKLSARHVGAEVLVTVSDDGRGLDRDRIRARAEEQGLVAPGAKLADSELFQVILQPGFSTATQVTNLSGRGVGMDVVKRAIEALRGSIDIASERGRGTEVTLRLPLTLAIIDGLLVRVGDSKYVLPLAAVEECVELSATDDARTDGRSFLNIRGDLVPFLRLREMFGCAAPVDPMPKVVIVSSADMRVGLVVDQVIGNHQTVIKSLSKLHSAVDMFSGATILGDGTVALIMEIASLVERGQPREERLKAVA
ncbi:MAG TPA: chemotaxis protein CheA [Xanthobacteraceae bacterium]|nr:chemotaxis protein CheA [Xanthobacteraceae bacterium]